MILVSGLLGLLLLAAAAITPAVIIAETHGNAIGWATFLVISSLFEICAQLRMRNDKQEKFSIELTKKLELIEHYLTTNVNYEEMQVAHLQNIELSVATISDHTK